MVPDVPPPLPGKRKTPLWPFFLGFFGLALVVGFVVAGVVTFQKVQEKVAARKQAYSDLEKSANEARTKMAESLKEGHGEEAGSALGQMQDALGKTAAQLHGSEADGARVMSTFLGKLQTQLADYQAATNHFSEAKIFMFDVPDHDAIEAKRVIVREFLASNARLTDLIQHGDLIIRADLEAAKIPAATRDGMVAGFTRSQAPTKSIQLKIRQTDQIVGECAITALNLLEKSWGKWSREPASGQLRFNDDETLDHYNQIMDKVQEASAEQAKAQQDLAEELKKARPR